MKKRNWFRFLVYKNLIYKEKTYESKRSTDKKKDIDIDIQSINALRHGTNINKFYEETLKRTIINLELYKDYLINAIEAADIN